MNTYRCPNPDNNCLNKLDNMNTNSFDRHKSHTLNRHVAFHHNFCCGRILWLVYNEVGLVPICHSCECAGRKNL